MQYVLSNHRCISKIFVVARQYNDLTMSSTYQVSEILCGNGRLTMSTGGRIHCRFLRAHIFIQNSYNTVCELHEVKC